MLWSQKQADNLIFIWGGPAYNLNWVADVFLYSYTRSFIFLGAYRKLKTSGTQGAVDLENRTLAHF